MLRVEQNEAYGDIKITPKVIYKSYNSRYKQNYM